MTKILVTIGIVFIIAGVFWEFFSKMPFLGRLPGDIFIQKRNFTFYFPVMTSIILSVVLSIILWLFRK